jgi:hypothetical protein
VAEHDRLPASPVLVKDLDAIFGRDGTHVAPPMAGNSDLPRLLQQQ